jgi:hypothetical protein
MPRIRLNREEVRLKENFVRAVEELMLDFNAETVGRIADYVGEHGTDGDGGAREDAAVVECLRIIVDAMVRR